MPVCEFSPVSSQYQFQSIISFMHGQSNLRIYLSDHNRPQVTLRNALKENAPILLPFLNLELAAYYINASINNFPVINLNNFFKKHYYHLFFCENYRPHSGIF